MTKSARANNVYVCVCNCVGGDVHSTSHYRSLARYAFRRFEEEVVEEEAETEEETAAGRRQPLPGHRPAK